MSDERVEHFVTGFAIDCNHQRRDMAVVLDEIGVTMSSENGLEEDEIKEVLLQSAIYCGVPAANHAFAVAQEVLEGH